MRRKRKVFVCVLFFIAIFSVGMFPFVKHNEKEISQAEKETNTLLVSMENKDITEIQSMIEDAQASIYNNEEVSIKLRFRKAVLIGDSVAEGMNAYDVIDKRNNYYKRGLRIDNSKEYIDQALKIRPDVVFLQFGINDLEYHGVYVNNFIEEYKKQIAYIQSKNKDCVIYVNSILPIAQFAINETPAYANYKTYNEALRRMCIEAGCIFIDNTSTFAKVGYKHEFDGVHPCPQYYDYWAYNMLEKAGL